MTVSAHLTTFLNKKIEDYSPEKGIGDPSQTAYRISIDYDEYDDGKKVTDKLDAFAADPKAPQASELIIGAFNYESSESSEGIIQKLVELKDRLTNLRAIFIGDITFEECEISWIIGEIEILRGLLPKTTYLWVNALKKKEDYYTEEEKARLIAVDPYVVNNMIHHDSLGRPCRTGHTVISVDGEGHIYRCQFIKDRLGNLYEPGWEAILQLRPCTNDTCGCHIGYVHLEHLRLDNIYKGKELERIISTSLFVQSSTPA